MEPGGDLEKRKEKTHTRRISVPRLCAKIFFFFFLPDTEVHFAKHWLKQHDGRWGQKFEVVNLTPLCCRKKVSGDGGSLVAYVVAWERSPIIEEYDVDSKKNLRAACLGALRLSGCGESGN